MHKQWGLEQQEQVVPEILEAGRQEYPYFITEVRTTFKEPLLHITVGSDQREEEKNNEKKMLKQV